MNQSGMNRLLSDKFTISREAAAAGPVGQDASANTDVLLHTEILSWSLIGHADVLPALYGRVLIPEGVAQELLTRQDATKDEALRRADAKARVDETA